MILLVLDILLEKLNGFERMKFKILRNDKGIDQTQIVQKSENNF